MTTIYIKNMVCPRCVMAVEQVFSELGIPIVQVRLGEVTLSMSLEKEKKKPLAEALHHLGFELLENTQTIVVESIKRIVVSWVRIKGEHPTLSDYLQSALRRDYSTLSKLFSETCGITIERFCIRQRIEYVKELLCYEQQNIKEIAYTLGYSSPAHLSSQFKQETGVSPKQFKNGHEAASRKFIDSL